MMKRKQIKQLKAEAAELHPFRFSARKYVEIKLPVPVEVKKARKISDNFASKKRKLEEKLLGRYKKLYNQFEHALYFKTEKEALAALQKVRKFRMEYQ